ncbi:site-2 protease family protein [Desulforamulus hydrothermalis]|uniref:Putative zinc metalloprotease ywhC n=1 Tax=Desulforamulus hydrothermalis Lam5 = DSM 18033 TaxID=1121428 RepID=K8E0J6_9FIRM|nr:site-2 protease family protein [Desulforamulus hydrothermalis]CCO08995.1 putative zinc metalloprotease ywhC [Desulforamulus hydrothermalis Lam5 = DSM 18033]SHG76492.1 Zn-dependent protease (includes SpoIVFB) [Desulforamulus hydrothermalis Lam5 = DSM 18033]
MFGVPSIEEVIYKLLLIFFALPLHEYAHGLVAYKLGDPTAKYEGRLTLNPFKHLDPLGTILIFFGPIGWAKPVPVNPFHFANRKKGMMLVSLAGPGANFLLAVIGAMLLGIFYQSPVPAYIFENFMVLNVWLAVFNLLPLPPLDGSKILAGLLPGRQAWLYELERYGFAILFLLIFFGFLTPILIFFAKPVIKFLVVLANLVAGLPL